MYTRVAPEGTPQTVLPAQPFSHSSPQHTLATTPEEVARTRMRGANSSHMTTIDTALITTRCSSVSLSLRYTEHQETRKAFASCFESQERAQAARTDRMLSHVLSFRFTLSPTPLEIPYPLRDQCVEGAGQHARVHADA